MIRKAKQILLKKKSYIFWMVFLLILTMISLLAPILPISPDKIDIAHMSQGPSISHIFGTDEVGRDYFIRVIYGGRVSLFVGFLSMTTAIIIGVTVGVIAGYFGGVIDTILMRMLDALSAIPWLVLVIVLSAFLTPGLTTIIIVIGGFSWMNIARLVRAETLTNKTRDFVIYAKFIGQRHVNVIFKHILPIIMPTIITAAGANIANAIMTESALSFLGLGIQPPNASWGSLLQSAQGRLEDLPYMAIIPGLFIILTVLSFNSIGNFLSDFSRPEGIQ